MFDTFDENTSIVSLRSKLNKYTPAETTDATIISNEYVLKNEFNKREPFTTIFYTNQEESSVYANINTIHDLQKQVNLQKSEILNTYSDISNNLNEYNFNTNFLHINNAKYHYDDTLSSNTILKREDPSDIKVAIKNDIHQIQMYQNSIYITSAIACATLLIAAIMIMPEKK